MPNNIKQVQGDRRPVITITLRDKNNPDNDPADPDSWPVIDLSAGLDGIRVDYYQSSLALIDIIVKSAANNTLVKQNTGGDDVPTGLQNNDRVRFMSSGTLPAGLVENTLYYVVNAIDDTDDVTAALTLNSFQVSATKGGAAVDITDTGTGQLSFIKQFETTTGTLVGSGSGGQFTYTHPALVFETPGHYEVEYVVRWTAGKETVFDKDSLEIRSK